MPKKISYEQIDKNTYIFHSKIKLFSGSNCKITGPTSLGMKLQDKKVKVTVEVIE